MNGIRERTTINRKIWHTRPRSLHANLALLLVSLGAGALLLLVAVTGFFLSGDRYTERATQKWDGDALHLLSGKGGPAGGALGIESLDIQRRAVLALPNEPFDAAGVVQFRLQVSELNPRHTRTSLVWRETSAPNRLRSTTLQLVDGSTTIDLSDIAGWSGEIAAPLLLVVEGVLLEPLSIQRVELLPADPKPVALVRTILQEWTQFEGWRGHSINFIAGGPRNPLVSPVLAVALWLAFSAAVYVVLSLVRRRTLRVFPFAVIVLIGWIVLDARWQWDLVRQIQSTHAQFAGKSHDQRTHNATDNALFDLANIVKTEFAVPGTRVMMFSDQPTNGPHDYHRVRLHHHLLPLNTAAVWEVPRGSMTTPGDLIIVFSNHTRLTYDADARALLWGRDKSLAVEPLLEHSLATVYRAI